MSEQAEEEKIYRPTAKWLHHTVDALCKRIEALPKGDQSALRKLTPHTLDQPAFWKLSTSTLANALAESGALRAAQEQRWAVVIAVAAGAFHSPKLRLGTALAKANVAEMRVTRLLRARGEQLADAVRSTTHQLIAAAVPFDLADLAWLVLSEDRDDEDRARQQIARDYYTTTAKTED